MKHSTHKETLCLDRVHCAISLFRPDLEELIAYMCQLGASEVITEEVLASYHIKEILKVSPDHVMVNLPSPQTISIV